MKLKAINYHVIVQIQNTVLSQHVSHPFSKASEDICRVDPEGCSLKRTTTVKATVSRGNVSTIKGVDKKLETPLSRTQFKSVTNYIIEHHNLRERRLY